MRWHPTRSPDKGRNDVLKYFMPCLGYNLYVMELDQASGDEGIKETSQK